MAGAVTVTPFGTPAMVRATTGSITASWGTGQNRAAGNILVAVVTAGCSTAAAIAPSTPAGWTQEVISPNTATTYNAVAAIYTKIAAGADAAPAFTATLTGTGAMTATLFELGGAGKPNDTTGTYASGASAGTLTAMTVTSAAAPTNAGEYAITGFAMERAASTNTWNPGTGGWSNAANDGATSSVLHSAVDVLSGPATSGTLTEAGNFTTNTTAFGAAVMFVAVPLLGATEVYADNPSTTISSGGTTAPAAGTVELWTAASSAAFPAVTVQGAAQFHIVDPAVPAELMCVLNVTGTTWTVVRGAEGTAPAAHTTGFTVQQVATAGSLGQTQQVFNVRAFGAKGDATTDDTAAIQAAINTAESAINLVNGGVVYVPPGAYKITAPLSIPGLVTFLGAGRGPFSGNIAPTTIFQTTANANGINLIQSANLGNSHATLDGFLLIGTGSGTGKGIYLAQFGAPVGIRISNVTVDSFGGNGIELTNPIVSRFESVISQFNGGEGFYFTGGTGGSTSLTFTACWANGNALTGWHIFNTNYSSLTSCAADGNGRGYYIDTCIGVGLHACGAESNVAKNALDGSSCVITGSRGVTLTDFATFSATAVTGVYVTGSSTGITALALQESSPAAGATNSIKCDTGSRINIISPFVTTAISPGPSMEGINYDGAGSWQATGNMGLSFAGAGTTRNVEAAQAAATGAVTVTAATITSLGSMSIPANEAVAGSCYRFAAYGTLGTASAAKTATVDIRWGGTAGTLITSILTGTDTAALAVSLSAVPVRIEGEVQFVTSTTCVAWLRLSWKNSATAATAMTVAEKAITAPVTVTTSAQELLTLDWTWSATGTGLTITIASSSFERVS